MSSNRLQKIAEDIAAKYDMKGCIVILVGEEGALNNMRIGVHNLEPYETLDAMNLFTYYAIKKELDKVND